MRLKARLVGAVVLLAVGGLWWQSGNGSPLGDDPDVGRKQISLIGTSSESHIYISARVTSSVRGIIYEQKNHEFAEPWLREFTVAEHEILSITLTVTAVGPRNVGHKVIVGCRVMVDGIPRSRDGMVLHIRDFQHRIAVAHCEPRV